MSKKKSFPGPLSILMLVIVIAAISTWIIPAGQYKTLSVSDNKTFVLKNSKSEIQLALNQKTLDSLAILIPVSKFETGEIRKPVSVPATYQKMESNPQGFIAVLQAPVKGILDSIDIILFILIIGGFMFVFNETGAIVKGITALSYNMKGRESLLISILTFIFSFCGASYGMAEEALVFYPLLVPLFLAAGYDVLVPLGVIFGGTTVGNIAGFSNPFSAIIASNAAGINWMDGLTQRLILFVVITVILIIYLLKYAAKVKKNPTCSITKRIDGDIVPVYHLPDAIQHQTVKLTIKTKLLLIIYCSTFLTMIGGVVFLKWWTIEMSTLFLGSSLVVAIVAGVNEKTFTKEFIKGAESLLSVAFIVGVARGVTIVLNEGHISDSILYHSANLVQGMPPTLFVILLLVFYLFFTLFISSSSGMAVLTMPIIGALAIIVHIPGREIVNSYLYGMGIMSFISPTGMMLPSLALVQVSLKAWIKFIMPLLFILLAICVLALIVGIYL